MQFRNIINGDVHTVDPDNPIGDYFGRSLDWEQIITEDDAADLKGEALDAALEDHDLPKTGKADEKRKRLVETTQPVEADNTLKEN